MSVLVVEDDNRLRDFLAIVVRRCGLTCHSVSGGEAGLSAILSEKYSAVILDLMLPGMSGFEILQTLRATHPHVLRRIIVLTAVSQATLDQHFDSQSLIWALIRKPFDVMEVTATIQDCARFHSRVWPDQKEVSAWIAQRAVEGGAKAGIVAILDEGYLRIHASQGFAQDLLEKYFPLPVSGAYPLCVAVRNGRPVWLASLGGNVDYPLLSAWTASDTKSIAATPLMRRGKAVGAIGWSFLEPQRFDDRQRAHFLTAASDCLDMVPITRGAYLQIS
jgi:CheY-like chemotaxis protein